MKHIKRKFSGQVKVPGLTNTLDKVAETHPEINDFPKTIPEGWKGVLFTDTEETFYAFSYKEKSLGRDCIVPEPEPTLVYFNVAQFNHHNIVTERGRDKLVEMLSDIKASKTNEMMHSLYTFLGESSSFAVFLFMAMESAVNRAIPDKFELKKPGTKKTVIYDHLQVQQLEFKEKVKEILSSITGRKFWNDHPTEWNFLISDLKLLRDEIVHTKKLIGSQTHYKDVYVMALNFDYSQAILYAKTFINYYHPNLVEECNCGASY